MPKHQIRNRPLVATSILLYVAIFLLDAATLRIMLLAMGQDVSFLVAFPSFVVSSIIATLSPIPLGLGIFEASSTGMLSILGISRGSTYIYFVITRFYAMATNVAGSLAGKARTAMIVEDTQAR